ncbi:kunitz trypsin inhibitor 5-like [Solanum dulcamara]|uniref:kunitz trypsin inhibitor 5-like n=1 Tax=Solanum dulcamara TaxID=45834 RepID=UPI002486C929|nr:kunitz trypsin inhibitor 5-like [Solanum dulcamara]
MNKVLILLLLSVFSMFTSSNCTPESDPILDINGKILRTHTTYFVVPVNHKYGGISLETTGNEKCQLGIVQEIYDVHGGAVALFPVNPKKGIIRVSTDLNVAIFSTHGCGDQSTVWQLETYDSKTGKYFIKDRGVEGNPGPKTIRNWFKIEKYEQGYKFVYCPSVCTYCKVICKDVGVYMVNGQRRLALSNVPLVFNFKKEFTS